MHRSPEHGRPRSGATASTRLAGKTAAPESAKIRPQGKSAIDRNSDSGSLMDKTTRWYHDLAYFFGGATILANMIFRTW